MRYVQGPSTRRAGRDTFRRSLLRSFFLSVSYSVGNPPSRIMFLTARREIHTIDHYPSFRKKNRTTPAPAGCECELAYARGHTRIFPARIFDRSHVSDDKYGKTIAITKLQHFIRKSVRQGEDAALVLFFFLHRGGTIYLGAPLRRSFVVFLVTIYFNGHDRSIGSLKTEIKYKKLNIEPP